MQFCEENFGYSLQRGLRRKVAIRRLLFACFRNRQDSHCLARFEWNIGRICFPILFQAAEPQEKPAWKIVFYNRQ